MSKAAHPGAPNKRAGSQAGVFRADLVASIVVFLVALPLCIGIAVAVGVSPARALITGIIGGVIVGYLAGSPLQVSGPAAGLFVLVAELLGRYQAHFREMNGETMEAAAMEAAAMEYSLAMLGVAVFVAGVLQFAAGYLKLGQWFRAVSPSVIQGMLAGIGVLILVSQFHVMLDHTATWHGKPAHGGLQYMATIPEAIAKCFSSDTSLNHHLAAGIGLITIGIIVAWKALTPKWLKVLPGPLVAIVAAAICAYLWQIPIQRLQVPSNLLSEVTWPSWLSVNALVDPEILISALAIGLIASAETLLCATAVDQMQTRARTNFDRELWAQGVGNMACGLLGALPMTGVIVRSSANVDAGAQTRWSTILHGFWLLLFVVFLPQILTFIPRAALGALLVYTGYKLVNIKAIRELGRFGRSEILIYAITLLLIVTTDLLTGVLVGVALSAGKLLLRFSFFETDLVSDRGKKVMLNLRGSATFIRLPVLARQLERVPSGSELHVDIHDLNYIDHACLDLLSSWKSVHEANGGKLLLDWDQLHGRSQSGPEISSSCPGVRDGFRLEVLELGPGTVGLPLGCLDLSRDELLPICLERESGEQIGIPADDLVLESGDKLHVYGHSAVIRRERERLASQAPEMVRRPA